MSWFYFTIGAVVFFAVLVLLQRKIAVESKYPRAASFVFNFYAASFATLMFTFSGGYKNFNLPKDHLAFIFLFVAAICYAFFERGRFFAARMVDASTLSIVSNIEPVVAFFCGLVSLF